MGEIIRKLEQISKHDTYLAGGKEASLGEMTQAGIPVPPGFVALSTAFEQFLRKTDLSVEIESALDTVNVKEMHTVEHAAIVSRELGKPCIVGIKNLIASVHDGDEVEVDAEKGTVRVIS